MVVQERLALEVRNLPDDEASLVAVYVEKLKKKNLTREKKKELAKRKKAYRRLQRLLKRTGPITRPIDYKAELEEALREKYESLG